MLPETDPPASIAGGSTILSDDQRAACERLTTLARVRAATTEAALPTTVLSRWSVPFLVGPAGVGKGHVCREVARRLGHGCYRRWEAGAWMLATNRSSGTTLDQIEQYIERCSRGCVIYLASIEAMRVSEERNSGWHFACLGEIERFLDDLSCRPARFARRAGTVLTPRNVLVVVGGRFAGLWGEHEPGGPAGQEAWKTADKQPLSNARAVSAWLDEHSALPASVLQLLAPEPLLVRRPDREQAERLATHLRDALPPAYDGLEAGELSAALQGAHGWRAVSALIEQAWVDGHEGLLLTGVEDECPPETATAADPAILPPPASAPPEPPPLPPLLSFDPPPEPGGYGSKPERLADRLGMGAHRSTLLPKARRLGLVDATHLEALAVARGNALPGDAGAVPVLYVPGAWRQDFSDEELAVALLSPGLEYGERVVCRGALMLRRRLLTLEPASMFRILQPIHQEHAYAVVRHVVRLGQRKEPSQGCWRTLLSRLPEESPEYPAVPAGALPDQKILAVFGADYFDPASSAKGKP